MDYLLHCINGPVQFLKILYTSFVFFGGLLLYTSSSNMISYLILKPKQNLCLKLFKYI